MFASANPDGNDLAELIVRMLPLSGSIQGPLRELRFGMPGGAIANSEVYPE